MKEYINCLILTHGTAFGVAAAIFLLTLLLVARRFIGFTLSVILMLLAIGAAWAIDHEEIVRSYLDKWIPTTQNVQTAKPASSTYEPAKAAPAEQNASVEGSLKGPVEEQKARVQNFLEDAGTKPATQ